MALSSQSVMTLAKADGAATSTATMNNPLRRLECMIGAPPVVGNPRRRIAAATVSRGTSAVNEPEGSPSPARDGRLTAGNLLRLMGFRHFARAPQSDPLVLRLK